MTVIGHYTKQPDEIEDYDTSFSEYLRDGETLASCTADAVCVSDGTDTDLTVVGSSVSGSIARVRLSGGTDNELYKVTLSAVTSAGRTPESEFTVRIREA